MGCKQSKANEEVVSPPSAADAGGHRRSKGESPRQSKSGKKTTQIRNNADLYHYLLSGLKTSSQEQIAQSLTESFWEEAQRLCSSDTTLASYIDVSWELSLFFITYDVHKLTSFTANLTPYSLTRMEHHSMLHVRLGLQT